ncbi:MAG: hypothetical protein U9O98_02495 [Asgard group archaeon]|nr:hypothetical protein [Asgard group archaeon]
MTKVITPEKLKNKDVYDINDKLVGKIAKVKREKYQKIAIDFLVIEFDKRVPIGYRDYVSVRTKNAKLLENGIIKVKYTKKQLKKMSKEQELQKHPPRV